MTTSKKPNIVLLVNDHQAYYRHGWDGGVRPLTPNFDRIAREGMLFTRAYTAVPLCGPSRRTMLTGLYPHNHQNYYNYTDAPYEHEIYLDTLAEGGYQNHYFGKWHAGPGTALDFNCEGFSDTDYGNPYIHPVYKAYLQRKGLPQAEHYVERHFSNEVFRQQFPKLRDHIVYRSESAWCGEHAVGVTTTPKETHEAFFLADLACDALEELANEEGEQPFHLRVDFWGPHQPFFPTKEFIELYDPKDIPEYGSFRDTLQGKPELFHHDNNQPLCDENNKFRTPSPLPWKEWQGIVARAFAHITMIDAAGGLILDKLEELGLTDNTIVIWTADHGDALASHGGRFDKGSYVTEEVLRVPLAVRWPQQIAPEQTNDNLVCNIDLAPTLVDMAGTKFAGEVDGRSWLPLATSDNVAWRDALGVESFGHGYGLHHVVRAQLAGGYKYIDNDGQLDELYHLETDPYELHNLIDDPAHQSALIDMRQRLREWQEQTGDLGADDPNYKRAVSSDPANLRAMSARREEKLRRYRERE
jgi:arylsulfatase A-like enzyme